MHSVDGSLLATVCTSMPQSIRADLTERLTSCFDSNPLRWRNTEAEGEGGRVTFEAMHFSWYNRHAMKVCVSYAQSIKVAN